MPKKLIRITKNKTGLSALRLKLLNTLKKSSQRKRELRLIKHSIELSQENKKTIAQINKLLQNPKLDPSIRAELIKSSANLKENQKRIDINTKNRQLLLKRQRK